MESPENETIKIVSKLENNLLEVNIDEIFDDVSAKNLTVSTDDEDYEDDDQDDDTNSSSFIPVDKVLSKKAEKICKLIEENTYSNDSYVDDTKTNELTYFFDYFPKEIFESIAEQSILYANKNKSENIFYTDAHEIQEFFGIHIIMSILKYPRYSMYWSPLFRITSITERMSQKRFENLRVALCVVQAKPPKVNGVRDNLWKIRPIVDSFVWKCQRLAKEENPCVDDQMIPFLIYLNSITLKVQRKVLRVLFAFVGLAVKNSWLEYKREAEKKVTNKMEIMDLLEFTLCIAELMLKTARPHLLVKRKRSNSSEMVNNHQLENSSTPNEQQPSKKYRIFGTRPDQSIRYDAIDHWPQMEKKPQRCKMEGCSKKASVRCEKCNVNLCMSSNRNCFKKFHTLSSAVVPALLSNTL